MWSFYINPQTGDLEASGGKLTRVSRARGQIADVAAYSQHKASD